MPRRSYLPSPARRVRWESPVPQAPQVRRGTTVGPAGAESGVRTATVDRKGTVVSLGKKDRGAQRERRVRKDRKARKVKEVRKAREARRGLAGQRETRVIVDREVPPAETARMDGRLFGAPQASSSGPSGF